MKPETLAKWVTPVLVLAILGFVVAKKSGVQWPSGVVQSSATSGSSPQDTIYATLDAARAGDAQAYLKLYAGPMRATLDETLKEKGEASFREYLKSSSRDLKGMAVFDPKPIADTQVQVRVEYVYQDRNEAQSFTLEKSGAGWKILQVENAERVKTVVPYGTPVQ